MNTQDGMAQVWTLRTAETVGALAVAAGAGWFLVATDDRTVHVVDEAGKVQGRFKAGQPIRQIAASRDGSVLTALAGDAIVYAFNQRGQLDWRVELGGAVTSFVVAPSGEHVAAVSDKGWLYTYSPATRERRLAPVGWPMASAVVLDSDRLSIFVAGDKGRIALLNAEGKPQWQKDLDCRIGPVSCGAGDDRLFVPAYKRGLLVFGADGREAGHLGPEGDVIRAAAGPAGYPVMVELSGGRFLLLDEDAETVWEHGADPEPRAWAFGAAGARLVVAEGERSVVAYRVQEAESAPPMPSDKPAPISRARLPEMPGPVDAEMPEYLEIEEAMGADTPAPSAPIKSDRHLKWKKRLPARLLPLQRGLLRVGADGAFTVMVLADGTVLSLDRQGASAVRCAVGNAAEIVPQSFAGTAAVRAGERLHVLEMWRKTVREVVLRDGEPVAFGCSDDLSALFVLAAEGLLYAADGDGKTLWRKALGREAESLLVSPDGRSLLVCDTEQRFRYYASEGGLRRKFRFGEAERHRAVALGNDFSAFVGPGGKLTVLDASGWRLWGRQLFQTVTRVERLEGALAVYGENGVCAAVEPLKDRVWEFVPPPGRVLLRKPTDGDPVIVHAAGDGITVFSGYRRKLDVLWRFRCTGEVEQFDVDREAGCIVALADGKLHRFECGRQSGGG